MKKTKKRFSALLAVIMLLTTVCASFPVSAGATDAYISNGKYYRWSGGKYIECLLSYNEILEQFQNGILNYEKIDVDEEGYYSLHCYFAEKESNTTGSGESVTSPDIALEEKIERDIFIYNDDNPKLGGYRFSSTDVSCSVNLFPSDFDTPVDGSRYHTYGIILKYKNHSTLAEERYVEEFAKKFSSEYIPSNATEYEKVKIIYDFVIRNAEYDYELYEDKDGLYSSNSDRFRISHSAYGAILGNRFQYLENDKATLNPNSDLNNDYENKYTTQEERDEYIRQAVEVDWEHFAYKQTITGQRVVKLEKNKKGNTISNGKAVCEGYANLFYYLCVYNGIESRIVDGDFIDFISNDSKEIEDIYGNAESGQESNPHQWNYVKLNDGSGEKWFIVDTTFSSQNSIKDIDINSYEFFLIGTDNHAYQINRHQRPYIKNGVKPQLYDWYYDEENSASLEDYNQQLVEFNSYSVNNEQDFVIERKTDYGEGEKYAYILQRENGSERVSIREDSTIATDDVAGFDYNGRRNAEYRLIIPYLAYCEYNSNVLKGISDVGEYSVTASGLGDSRLDVKFNIAAIDMSDDSNYTEKKINNQANYTGQEIVPYVFIVDGYKNQLTDKDYDIVISQNGVRTQLKEMGDYNIIINFKGNYSGSYSFSFNIGKIDLSTMSFNEYAFPYIPKSMREKEGIYKASDFFKKVSNIQVGTQKLLLNRDFTVSSVGEISSYGDSGTLTVSAIPSSELVLEGTGKTGSYRVSQKFDISGNPDSKNGMNLNGQYADSNSVNKCYYDGTAKAPTTFDNLEKNLEKGKDYKIVSYSNNVNAGKASVVIEGINGCTGRANMLFVINPANITTSKVTTSFSGSTLSVKVVHNGKTLVNGRDYNQTIKKVTNGYTVAIQGINNYAGTLNVNCADPTSKYVKPTSSGNKIKLSKTSYVYTGKACNPTVTLVNGSGKTINSYYYTVKYSSNVYVGTAKVTVTYRNGYKGTITASYKINPKPTTIKKLTAQKAGFKAYWNKQASQTTGYQIQYSTSSKFTKATTKTISKNSTVSGTYTKLSKGKRYYVRIRTYKKVGKTYYYSSWSAAKYVTTKK